MNTRLKQLGVQMTYKEAIIKKLADGKTYSCQDLCKAIGEMGLVKKRSYYYLSGCISSKLKMLFDDGVLDRVAKFGKNGGWGYKLKKSE